MVRLPTLAILLFAVALPLVPTPSIAENILLGLPPGRNLVLSTEHADIGKILFSFGFPSSKFQRVVSCADCHSDPLTHSGSSPQVMSRTSRSAPPLLNLAFRRAYGWEHNRNLESLISTAFVDEMQVSEIGGDLVRRLLRCSDANTCLDRVVTSLREYVVSRVSHTSRFDKYYYLGHSVLSDREVQGLELFVGKARCIRCHKINEEYAEFTDHSVHNIGLRILNGDHGRCITYAEETKCNFFFTPSLRDIARTAPYMHDGRFSNLKEVMEFYNKGGDVGVVDTDFRIRPLLLTQPEIDSVIAFLRTLDGNIGP